MVMSMGRGEGKFCDDTTRATVIFGGPHYFRQLGEDRRKLPTIFGGLTRPSTKNSTIFGGL
jgi:hypothetical protein